MPNQVELGWAQLGRVGVFPAFAGEHASLIAGPCITWIGDMSLENRWDREVLAGSPPGTGRWAANHCQAFPSLCRDTICLAS